MDIILHERLRQEALRDRSDMLYYYLCNKLNTNPLEDKHLYFRGAVSYGIIEKNQREIERVRKGEDKKMERINNCIFYDVNDNSPFLRKFTR